MLSSTRLTKVLQFGNCILFHNAQSLFQRIDMLPSGLKWVYKLIEVKGDIVDKGDVAQRQKVELWH